MCKGIGAEVQIQEGKSRTQMSPTPLSPTSALFNTASASPDRRVALGARKEASLEDLTVIHGYERGRI
jgi:hypothetical protein